MPKEQPHGDQARRWSWQEGSVDQTEDHFQLTLGSGEDRSAPHALVGPGAGLTLTVEFVQPLADDQHEMLRTELDHYIGKLPEPDLWAYLIYHCSTSSNAYSNVHWGHVPAQPDQTGKRDS